MKTQKEYIDPNMSDVEITAKLNELKGKSRIGLIIGIVMAVVLVLGGILSQAVLFFIGIAGIAAGVIVYSIFSAKIKNLVSSTIVKQAIDSVFENAVYDHNGKLSEYIVRNTDMGFPFDFDEIHGNDYVRGTYKGLNVEMSDIKLVDVTVTYDKDGHAQVNKTTVFKGLWLVCDFGKKLTADLRLAERGALGKKIALGGIKTESEEFNKHFHIQSENEHEVFYILTPHMMEYILQMDARGKGSTYMRFIREGKVHIAINSNRDSFEVKGHKIDVDSLRGKFAEEIKYITDIIDELRLVDTLTV